MSKPSQYRIVRKTIRTFGQRGPTVWLVYVNEFVVETFALKRQAINWILEQEAK
jgi:hypothetical protein